MINSLNAATIGLTGRHLIEASAGTGKTYNITRLYLRLLLERDLTVQQILVMTFTKDATEEIRGRIESFIRTAIEDWDTLVNEDQYFTSLNEKVSADKRLKVLHQALINLDEAAIFTIHGFCKRVLSQHAFLTGVSFNASMEVDARDLVVQSCQDWFRNLANENPEDYQVLAQFWPTPETFIQAFFKAINHRAPLSALSDGEVKEGFIELVRLALQQLNNNHALLIETLIDVKKGADKQKRIEELDALKNWLITVQQDFSVSETPFPKAFIDGKRFSKSVHKEALKQIFSPCQQLSKALATLPIKLSKAQALKVAKNGIYQIREKVTNQKLTANMLTFDDLIGVLADRLSDDDKPTGTSKLLAEKLATQYPAALIDEFQDTDPLQFSILSAIYCDHQSTVLYLIGDPKQAIYGFRGGDVFAYLQARNICEHHWVMDTNWRSSPGVVAGYNRLFYGNPLNKDAQDVFKYGIEYQPVKAAKTADSANLDNRYKAIQFIHFSGEQQPQSFRTQMATWCANEILTLLNETSVASKDIAILVRDGTEAADIKVALQNANLASVYLSNRANLWQSTQSKQLLLLLKGIVYFEDKRQFNAALTSQLLQLSPLKFVEVTSDEASWQYYVDKFSCYRQMWSSQSFITMAISLLHDLMSFSYQQDRELTNVLHLFELLQSASQRHRQPTELLAWFEQQLLQEGGENEAELRLESEENLIKIITQHGSKGLEYPVVFIPFSTRHKDPLKVGVKNVELIEYHDNQRQLLLSLDANKHAKSAMAEEHYAETVRLLYVAITRAEQRCYILTTNFDNAHRSPLGQTLNLNEPQNLGNALQCLVSDEPEYMGLELISEPVVSLRVDEHVQSNIEAQEALFKGSIERNWWLSSFSSLSRNIVDIGVSNPDRDTNGIEAKEELTQVLPSQSIRFDIEKGARTGNLLHDILENLDFERVNDSESSISQAMENPLLKFGELDGFTEHDLMQWLIDVVNAPLFHTDTIDNSVSLSDVSFQQSIRECEFYFPLTAVLTRHLVKLLSDHRIRINKQLVAKDVLLTRPMLPNIEQLNGMMHGFIDLIFEYQGKYYIADYKSNYLGDCFEDYRQECLVENIQHHHYDLQYLIYSVALHRYLSQKLANYKIEQHFGGCLYLYLRGMSPVNKHHEGVYFCHLPPEELLALDRLFTDQDVQTSKDSQQDNEEVKW
ncbi:exodeoxyribonuclease V subunit beta [Thalassotalea ganghwensis]